ncbi:MAG: iron ABC transporter permease, partial [Phycisphaerae bacterium]|nr:iron ABC transporter permease [Phycisphaerae bacterium]
MTDSPSGSATDALARRWRPSVPVLLLLLLLGVCLARLAVGEPIPRTDGEIDWPLLRQFLAFRFDRMIIALVVGAALATSGVVLQALLGNPLASPYILGVSSGAALGVMVAWSGWLAVLGSLATHTAAVAGALGTMFVVFILAQRRGRIHPLGLLLVGVIVNTINAAAIMFIHYLNPNQLRADVVAWMMGYIDENTAVQTVSLGGGIQWSLLTVVALVTLGGWVVAVRQGPAMDAASFSEAEAHSVGVNLPRLRLCLFLVAGLLTAGSVMLAGPVGFVGLICPHIVRRLMGPSHRGLLVGSALAGAVLVVGADALTRLLSRVFDI